MRYLLLGGSGFIGTYLAKELAKQHSVVVIGHQPTVFFSDKNIEYRQLDFVKCRDFSKYIQDVDVIVHMVSTTTPTDRTDGLNAEIDANLIPSIKLFDDASKLGKTVVFISSGGAIYGESAKKNRENDALNPICSYGIVKLAIEKYLEMYGRYFGLNYKIIRPSNPYDENIQHEKKQGIVPVIIDCALNGKELALYGSDQTVRDYIHISDLIEGIKAVLDYKGKEKIFNIGTGRGYTTREVIDEIEKQTGKKIKIKMSPMRKCDAKENVLDISLINKETGWEPKISLGEGIKRALESKQKTSLQSGFTK